MAHLTQQNFCLKIKEKYPEYFKNKKVLDIGSLDINGNNRFLFEDCNYIGIDVGEGNNVDVVSIGHQYDAPDNYFDIIITTNALEHDMHYEKTIINVMRMLKSGGLFIFTCASTGWPEHGTRRTSAHDSPLLIQQSETWADYYKNLTEDDIRKINGFNLMFPDCNFKYDTEIHDIHFFGIKGGAKYLTESIIPKFDKNTYIDDIFVVDYWIDTESKENDLINLIKRLKIYNIPILLTGHHPLKPEIQKMVDYYLYDKNNPILTSDEYNAYAVASGRWTEIGSYRIDNVIEFHHDYAIWETMRNAFNFCNYLGKKNIHFLEYDCLPDETQFRQAFIEKIKYFDVVLYEYHNKIDSDPNLAPFCATYIFSIKTDIAIKVVDLIKTKKSYFYDKPNGWNLERVFLDSVKKITNNIHMTKYTANNNELNTQAVWNRDGIDRNNGTFQIYLVADDNNLLYIHLISGFYGKSANENYLVEVNYLNHKKFYSLSQNNYITENIGKYEKGNRVTVYHKGIEVFNEFLKYDNNDFKKLNKLTIKTSPMVQHKPKEIDINFINGAFIEIKDNDQKTYHIQFINSKTNKVEYELDMKSNHWAKCSIKYYVDWIIKIKGTDNDYYYEYIFNPKNRRFLISFESKSLGDNLAWIGQVEAFRLKHNCNVICSTFHNNLFKNQYPEIEFVEPGTTVNNLYGSYELGFFYDNDKNLQEHYNENCLNTLGDIYQHLPTLKKYAEDCDHITEFGVRTVVSTYAFMMGKPKRLISYDLVPIEEYGTNRNELKELGQENNVNFNFIVGDTREIVIEETDLLFIDTWHIYDQLNKELKIHGNKSRKYLIFHDTTTFGLIGEDGYTGIWQAIEEFLSENKHWTIHERFTNNNGLTILKRT